MKIQADYIFEDKSYHFIRSVDDFDRNYDDESYAYFIEPRTNTEDGFFEINILRNDDGDVLQENGYVAVYDSTDQTATDIILTSEIRFVD